MKRSTSLVSMIARCASDSIVTGEMLIVRDIEKCIFSAAVKHNLAVNTQRTPGGVPAGFREKVSSERCSCCIFVTAASSRDSTTRGFNSSVSIHSAIMRYLTVSHTVPELAVVWYNEPAHRLFEPINGPPYGHGSLAALVRAYPVPWQFEIGGWRSERTPLLQYISSPDSFCAATLPAAFGQLPPRPPWQIQA
jgi:hypothetical protein